MEKKSENPAVGFALISGICTIVFLFMPPSAFRFQNPPPTGLVFNWWLRILVALGLLLLNAFALRAGKASPPCSRYFLYVVCAVSSGLALFIVWGISFWASEFPTLFKPFTDWGK